MNYLSKITSFSVVLLLMFSLQPVRGQSDIDTNRMQRDINIMENVLEEMFKTRWEAHGNTVQVHSGGFAFGRNDDIRGTYIPGYGVIFTIPGGPPAFVMEADADSEDFAYTFQYGNNDGEKVDEKSITARIVEFLRDYGSTIGQLSNSDNIMVIYNSNTPDQGFPIFHSDDNDKNIERQQIPTISVVAKKSDLQAYRSGDLSNGQFRNRLDISTVAANSQNQKALKVFAGIFETAFEDSDEKSFQISGSVDYLKLDNFGALFSFDMRYANHGLWDFSGLPESLKGVREELVSARIELAEEIGDKVDSLEIMKEEEFEKQKEIEEKREQKKEEVTQAYDRLLTDLKGYLVDYGRTLSSVESNQHVLISVTLSSKYDEIPERLDLQIQKSDLEAMDSGNLSREQAINQINVREY